MAANIIVPDSWVVVCINTRGNPSTFKLLTSYSQGCASGPSWRLSSPIAHVTQRPDYYHITTQSGSYYHCWNGALGLTEVTRERLQQWQQQSKDLSYTITEFNIRAIKL